VRCQERGCSREVKVVVDLTPWRTAGTYRHYCWPHYYAFCRAQRVPSVVNYLDPDEYRPLPLSEQLPAF
jgi:hypothetical protein